MLRLINDSHVRYLIVSRCFRWIHRCLVNLFSTPAQGSKCSRLASFHVLAGEGYQQRRLSTASGLIFQVWGISGLAEDLSIESNLNLVSR